MIDEQEFNDISSPWDLQDFFITHSTELLGWDEIESDDAFYDSYDYGYRVMGIIRDRNDNDFKDLARYLSALPDPDDSDYFIENCYGEFFTFDFDEAMESLRNYIIDNVGFTREEDEEEEELAFTGGISELLEVVYEFK